MTTRRTPTADPRAAAARPRSGAHRLTLCADLDHVADAHGLWSNDRGDDARDDAVRDAVRDAVHTALTARQREVVELHFFHGLSQGAIARRLGVTQQVVQKALHGASRDGRVVGGALAKLRATLAPLLAQRDAR